jgi:hypothetical protein
MSQTQKAAPADIALEEIKRRLLSGLRGGDIESATDALLEAWAHHGVVKGNMQALDRFAIGSGLVDGMKERQRVAKVMANAMSKALEHQEQVTEEPDYEARLNASGSKAKVQE